MNNTIATGIMLLVGFISTWGSIRQSIKHLEEQCKYMNDKLDRHIEMHGKTK